MKSACANQRFVEVLLRFWFYGYLWEMKDPHTSLNDKQRGAVRWLSQRVGVKIDQDDLCDWTGLSTAEYVQLRSILKSRGCLGNLAEKGMYPDTFTIDHPIVEFAQQMDSRDYPKEAETRIRSTRWSLLLWGVFFVLPAIVVCITMLKTLLQWFGVIE